MYAVFAGHHIGCLSVGRAVASSGCVGKLGRSLFSASMPWFISSDSPSGSEVGIALKLSLWMAKDEWAFGLGIRVEVALNSDSKNSLGFEEARRDARRMSVPLALSETLFAGLVLSLSTTVLTAAW